MKKPFLRIVMIARDNTSGALRKTLDSLMAQTYDNRAIDVIDYNDWDSAASLSLQEDIVLYPGVQYHQSPRSLPIGGIRNEALRMAECDYISFVSSNEVWEPKKAALQVYQLETAPRAAASCCDGHMVYMRTHLSDIVPCLPPSSYQATDWLLHRPVKTGGQMMYRAKMLEAIGGFHEWMDDQCDLDAMLRLRENASILFLPIPLVTCSVRVTRRVYLGRYNDRSLMMRDERYTDMLLADRNAFLSFNIERARLARKAGLPADSALLILLAFCRSPVRFVRLALSAAGRVMWHAAGRVVKFLRYARARSAVHARVRTGREEALQVGLDRRARLGHTSGTGTEIQSSFITPFSFLGDMSLAHVDIPGHVEEIGRGAYVGCSNLLSVTIPDSVRKIDSGAFLGCNNLREVRFGERGALLEIGESAFAGCVELTDISLPGVLRKIGKNCFAGCISLEAIHFYQDARSTAVRDVDAFAPGVQEIPDRAFMHCYQLKRVRFSEGSLLRRIGRSAFESCRGLQQVWLDAQVVSIGRRAFTHCREMVHFVIVNNVSMRHIGAYAFMNCEKLEQFVFPASMTRVERGTFIACRSLQSIRLPFGIQNVRGRAFQGCESLNEVFADCPYVHVHRSAFNQGASIIRGEPKKNEA